MLANDPGGGRYVKGGPDACLVLPGHRGDAGAARLAEALNESGFSVALPPARPKDETSFVAVSSNWRCLLDEAREAYAELDRAHDSVAVVGFAVGGAIALILAAEYPVSAVVAVCPALRLWDSPLLARELPARWALVRGCARVRDVLALERLARRSLFAVVAPALVIQPEPGASVRFNAARLLVTGVSSREKRIEWLPQSCRDFPVGAGCAQALCAIKNHLRHAVALKTLVN